MTTERGYGISGSEKKGRKGFSEEDVCRFLRNLREHGFGEITFQVVDGEIVRVRKQETHEPTD